MNGCIERIHGGTQEEDDGLKTGIMAGLRPARIAGRGGSGGEAERQVGRHGGWEAGRQGRARQGRWTRCAVLGSGLALGLHHRTQPVLACAPGPRHPSSTSRLSPLPSQRRRRAGGARTLTRGGAIDARHAVELLTGLAHTLVHLGRPNAPSTHDGHWCQRRRHEKATPHGTLHRAAQCEALRRILVTSSL